MLLACMNRCANLIFRPAISSAVSFIPYSNFVDYFSVLDHSADTTELFARIPPLLLYLKGKALRDSYVYSSSNNEFVPTDILLRVIDINRNSYSDALLFHQTIASAFADLHNPAQVFTISCSQNILCCFPYSFTIVSAESKDTAHHLSLIA